MINVRSQQVVKKEYSKYVKESRACEARILSSFMLKLSYYKITFYTNAPYILIELLNSLNFPLAIIKLTKILNNIYKQHLTINFNIFINIT